MINLYDVEKRLSVPNGTVNVEQVTVSAYRDKVSRKIFMEYKTNSGSPVKLIFSAEQEAELAEFFRKQW